jgi:glycosyltransferase involved in cell wall biosynthesis
MCWALDIVTILRMRRCDVFICMSGIYLHAPRFAQRRYGARVILHRGSTHILYQKDILAGLPVASQVSSFTVRREIEGYSIADRIAIPARHVMASFKPWPEYTRKLFLSPYGVDLDQFPLRSKGFTSQQRTILFVGQWSYRKGVDILVNAIQEIEGVRLIHVGALLDAPFPNHPCFVHHDPVPQWRLKQFYGLAHVFALASREDGFALVLGQALATGLRVVCTDHTGGADFADFPGLGRLIRVVPVGDVKALRDALAQALDDATGKSNLPPISQAEREILGWRRYGVQHLQLINELLGRPRSLPGVYHQE